MGVYQRSLRKLWEEWNVRTLVLLSLTFQILLTCLGSRRKYNRHIWIRIVVWFAYLMADTVATLALGAILSTLHDIYGHSGKVIPNVELNAFWAMFLLLHLGGPDTISAYALEDNELRLRHFLGLVGQAVVTLYIFLLAWTGSPLSILSIFMILVGLFKYGERIWTLWLASSEQREQFFRHPVVLHHDSNVSEETAICLAWSLSRFYMHRIVGPISRSEVIGVCICIQDGPPNVIRKLIEVELGFLYDLLYTKAKVVYTRCSLIMRLIGFSMTCTVLLLFSIGAIRMNNYSKVDIAVTFVLLVGAMAIDLYSAFLLLSSNWTTASLCEQTQTLKYEHTLKHSCCQAIAKFQKSLNKSPSWSIAQFSFLRFNCGEKKHVRFASVLKYFFPRVHKELEEEEYVICRKAEVIWNEQFIDEVRRENFFTFGVTLDDVVAEIRDLFQRMLGLHAYKEEYFIIIWHIATELCYNLSNVAAKAEYKWKCEISNCISEYIMYLFVRYPSSFSGIVAEDLFEKCCQCARATCTRLMSTPFVGFSDYDRALSDRIRFCLRAESLDFNTFVTSNENTVGKDVIVPVIHRAVCLSLKLDEMSDEKKKWEMIFNVWLKLLVYVASRWKADDHVQQLRRGGELITHVSLLLLHLNINGWMVCHRTRNS